MNKSKIEALQGIRAIAAIGVVMLHVAEATTKYSPFPARSLAALKFGNYGVDLFFVLSGFVMCYTTRDLSPWKFLRRRIERIVPIYWLFTILAAAVSMVFTVSDGRFTWTKFALSLGFISLPAGNFPVVSPGWTLEYEMLFYCCVTASLFLARRPWLLTTAVLSASIIAGTLAQPGSSVLSFLSAPIMLEFLAGIVIAQWVQNNYRLPVELAFVVVAAIAIFYSSAASQRPLFAGIPAAILVGLAVMARSRSLPKWIVLLGDASYSIYLIQIFTIIGCAKVLRAFLPRLDPDLFVAIATLVTALAGIAWYFTVETPIRNWLRARKSKPGTAVGNAVLVSDVDTSDQATGVVASTTV